MTRRSRTPSSVASAEPIEEPALASQRALHADDAILAAEHPKPRTGAAAHPFPPALLGKYACAQRQSLSCWARHRARARGRCGAGCGRRRRAWAGGERPLLGVTHARPLRPPPRLGRAVPWDARGCFLPAAGGRRRRKMPGKLKVKIVAGRHLPVMDRASDLTDAFVEVCGRRGMPGPGAGGRPPPQARTCRRARAAPGRRPAGCPLLAGRCRPAACGGALPSVGRAGSERGPHAEAVGRVPQRWREPRGHPRPCPAVVSVKRLLERVRA